MYSTDWNIKQSSRVWITTADGGCVDLARIHRFYVFASGDKFKIKAILKDDVAYLPHEYNSQEEATQGIRKIFEEILRQQ